MKLFFLKILLLCTGLAYTSSVFELDKNECKENFAKEQSYKVCCTKISDTKASFQVASPHPAELSSFNYNFLLIVAGITAENRFLSQFIPPNKIFIQHQALLI